MAQWAVHTRTHMHTDIHIHTHHTRAGICVSVCDTVYVCVVEGRRIICSDASILVFFFCYCKLHTRTRAHTHFVFCEHLYSYILFL